MTPKKIKVEWFKNPKSLSEIYQQTGMLFSFVTAPKDGKYSACHEWAKCRDFLHDAVRTQVTEKPSSIYGFTFDTKKNPPIDLKKTRMLVSKGAMKDEKEVDGFMKKIKYGVVLLQHFESLAGVSLSKMSEVDETGSGKKAVVMLTSSPMWMKSPFLVSMYTFLIRLGDKELSFTDEEDLKKKLKELNDKTKEGRLNDNDAKYVGASWDKLHEIIRKRKELFPKKKGFDEIYFAGHDISNFHNNGGIFSLARMCTPSKELNEKIKELFKK